MRILRDIEQLVESKKKDRCRRLSRYGNSLPRAEFYSAVLAVSHNIRASTAFLWLKVRGLDHFHDHI